MLTHLEEIKEDRFAKQVLNECCKIFGRRKKIGHEQVGRELAPVQERSFCAAQNQTQPPCNSLLEFFIVTQNM